MAGTLDPAVKPKEEKADALEELGPLADPYLRAHPKWLLQRHQLLVVMIYSAKSLLLCKRMGFMGRTPKKVEPFSDKGDASKDSPIDRVVISLIGIGQGLLSLPKCPC